MSTNFGFVFVLSGFNENYRRLYIDLTSLNAQYNLIPSSLALFLRHDITQEGSKLKFYYIIHPSIHLFFLLQYKERATDNRRHSCEHIIAAVMVFLGPRTHNIPKDKVKLQKNSIKRRFVEDDYRRSLVLLQIKWLTRLDLEDSQRNLKET